MNQAFSIFFSLYFFFGSLIPHTDFSQLLNTADFLEHYQEHKEKAIAGDLDFCIVEFIIGHYFDIDHEEEDHENLPFHNFNSSIELICDILVHDMILEISKTENVRFHKPNDLTFSDYTLTFERPPILG
ncbi:MAG: hypothetical protein V3V00_03110 [Saprospiraceae bacterium]